MRINFYIILLAVTIYSCNDAAKNETQAGSEPIVEKIQENQAENIQKCEAPWCTVGYTVYKEDGTPWFEVAMEDFPSLTSVKEAKLKCEKLGNGWRLPTSEELFEMNHQLYKKGKGSFGQNKNGVGLYCSSTESEKLFPVEQRDGSFVNEHKVFCYEIVNNNDYYFGVYLVDNGGFSLRPVRSL